MDHLVDWSALRRIEAPVQSQAILAPLAPLALVQALPAQARQALEEHFPWHRIRRMPRK